MSFVYTIGNFNCEFQSYWWWSLDLMGQSIFDFDWLTVFSVKKKFQSDEFSNEEKKIDREKKP